MEEIKPISNQQEINKYFDLERKKHFDFFLPFYREKNWLVDKDNINSGEKNDWDVRLEIFAGQFVLVDEKVRQGDFNDFLLELMQDIEKGKIGWFYSKKDWILYGSWVDVESVYPKSLYLVRAKELKEYVLGLDGFIKTCISRKGWGNTWNIVLQWDNLISKDIAEKLL